MPSPSKPLNHNIHVVNHLQNFTKYKGAKPYGLDLQEEVIIRQYPGISVEINQCLWVILFENDLKVEEEGDWDVEEEEEKEYIRLQRGVV